MNTNKLLTGLLFTCFPVLALAASGLGALNFAPPIGDFSVVFLSNIFGVVDGVLHGTGSQIMGNMFGVFNAAVLALGGIVIMYTLLVATLNTAHEGEVLGSQWSSIWIPMRATIGLALLIPKASGYCMMQIFIMWVIVQGVGAADKVWNAALSYLNRGGVIVQAQQDAIGASDMSGYLFVAKAAATILSGQVCMGGVQKALEVQRQNYLNLKNTGAGPCVNPNTDMTFICNNPIPDFVSTVNTVAVQSSTSPVTTKSNTTPHYVASMPNFDTSGPNGIYAQLNGVCGTITWSPISATQFDNFALTSSETQTAEMSRAIALQQMYMDLSAVAEVMVNNNPVLNPPPPNGPKPFSAVAQQQFGLPYLVVGTPCSGVSTSCQSWGNVVSTSNSPMPDAGAPLFGGAEFQGAMEDYSGIMMPTLTLINQNNDAGNAIAARSFINQAETQGWMMAGSYFFNLVQLNGQAGQTSNTMDNDPELQMGTFDSLSDIYSQGGVCGSSAYSMLCTWLNLASGQPLLSSVITMLDGTNLPGVNTGIQPGNIIPASLLSGSPSVIKGYLSATAYGYMNNAIMVQLPGQPGLTAPSFTFSPKTYSGKAMQMPTIDFGCGKVKTFIFTFCLGGLLGDVFYNDIFVNIYNYVMTYLMQFIDEIVQDFLMVPLGWLAADFKTALKAISAPTSNPIVSLANMGISYINSAGNIWMIELNLAIGSLIIPIVGVFMLALFTFGMPLIMSWIAVMVSIGFTTAYYIPILPYMIFTFGSLAWLMATIEAMVAAPLVALGVSNPEGHQAFGKAETAIMILMNVFLRPALMIIGYIAAIALSYVSVWVINAGFTNASDYLASKNNPGLIKYSSWASLYELFFGVLIYTTLYLTVVQKSFNLISDLPDKVLRWIGGTPESRGGEAAEWAGEVKGQVEKGGEASAKGQAAIQQKLKSNLTDRITKKGGGSMGAEGQ